MIKLYSLKMSLHIFFLKVLGLKNEFKSATVNKPSVFFCLWCKLAHNVTAYVKTLFFFQKTGFGISCKLSPEEKICMQCQSLFSGKNIVTFLSAELSQWVVKVNI